MERFTYYLYTIWLFPFEQVFDTVIPCTVFAISAAISGEVIGLQQQLLPDIYLRTPVVFAWLWTLMLQFCIQNQRHPHSISEDTYNKPWRPIPSGRIELPSAVNLLFLAYLLSGLFSYLLRVLPYFGLFTYFTICYNDFGGSDCNGFIKNALSAAGFACLSAGALKVAIGQTAFISYESQLWIGLMVLVLTTTIHAGDFRDERGDRARNRRTIITAIGQSYARWFLVAWVLLWSVFVPTWMGVGLLWSIPSLGLGMTVAAMTLKGMNRRDTQLDRRLYQVYSIWLLSFCPLPLYLRQI